MQFNFRRLQNFDVREIPAVSHFRVGGKQPQPIVFANAV